MSFKEVIKILEDDMKYIESSKDTRDNEYKEKILEAHIFAINCLIHHYQDDLKQFKEGKYAC